MGSDVTVSLLKRDVDALDARGLEEGSTAVPTITRGRVTFVDIPIPSGVLCNGEEKVKMPDKLQNVG